MSLIHGHKLVVATHNKGKLKEIEDLVAPFEFDVISAGDLGLPEPIEDGDSFVANALIKSRAAADASGLPALADDSGLCVWALANMPGIYSARWAGENKDFNLAMERVNSELLEKGIDLKKPFIGSEAEMIKQRGAFFVSALALSLPDGTDQTFEGVIEGNLTWPPRGQNGFGYDAMFIPEAHEETFGEMDKEEKYAISHRTRAFIKFRAAILEG